MAPIIIEIRGFADASEWAYGAVIYIVSIVNDEANASYVQNLSSFP